MNYQQLLGSKRADQPLPPVNPIISLYGEPGVGKTSLALTAGDCFLFDFNEAAYRAVIRAEETAGMLHWDNMLAMMAQGGFDELRKKYDCLVFDTIEDLLWKVVYPYLLRANPQFGTQKGMLKMYGAMQQEFRRLFDFLRSKGFTVVMVSHQKETATRIGDANLKVKPEITGKTYQIIMAAADVVGYIFVRDGDGTRHISFSPSANYYAKNPLNLQDEDLPFAEAGSITPEYRYYLRDRVVRPVAELSAKLVHKMNIPVNEVPIQQLPNGPQPGAPAGASDWVLGWTAALFQVKDAQTLAGYKAQIVSLAPSPDREKVMAIISAKEAELYGAAPPPQEQLPPPPQHPDNGTAPAVDQTVQIAQMLKTIFGQAQLPVPDFAQLAYYAGYPAYSTAGLTPELIAGISQEYWQNQIIPLARS